MRGAKVKQWAKSRFFEEIIFQHIQFSFYRTLQN